MGARHGLLGLGVLLAAFHAGSLKIFPPPNPDESMEANHSYTLLTTGENVYSLFEGVLPPGFEPLAHAFPNVLRPFYNGALAGAFRLGGVGLGSGRALSLAFSAAALALACWLAVRLTGSTAAAVVVLLLLGSNAVFTASSHDVRPEAMLGLAAMAAYACLCMGGRVDAIAAGFLAGVSLGVHTNGGAVVLAAVAALAVSDLRRLPFLAFGGLLAVVPLLWCVRPDRFMPGWVMFQGFFGYAPPYQTWGRSLPGMAAAELGRWIAPEAMGHEPMTGLFSWLLAFEWSLALAVWLAGWRVMKDKASRSLLAWIGAMTAFYAVFFANKNPQYLSVFEPFLALMFAVFLHRVWEREGPEVVSSRSLAAGAAGASAFALSAPFLVGPALSVLPWREKGERRWVVWLGVLCSLVPMFCLKVWLPAVFFASGSAGARALCSMPGALLALSVCAWLAWRLRTRRPNEEFLPRRGAAAGLAACLAVLVLCNGVEVARRSRSGPRFGPVEEGLRRLVPESARVLGPQRLWLALWDRPYRDWNALAYSRWLTGKGDVRRYVAAWRPDILLVDADFRRIFLRGGDMGGFADVPLESLGVLSAGPGFGQPIEVLRFRRPSTGK